MFVNGAAQIFLTDHEKLLIPVNTVPLSAMSHAMNQKSIHNGGKEKKNMELEDERSKSRNGLPMIRYSIQTMDNLDVEFIFPNECFSSIFHGS